MTESDKIAKDIITVFEAHHVTIELIKVHIAMEVKKASESMKTDQQMLKASQRIALACLEHLLIRFHYE